MTKLSDEAAFFTSIAKQVRELVQSFEGRATINVQKTTNDYATEVDIAVENLVVSEIKKRFPKDNILAEEGYSDTEITDARTWIIDPICGTTSVGRGITAFCTNIALAENKKLIASCVIDHSQNDYYWSVGDNKVYKNEEIAPKLDRNDETGQVIDVDMGSVAKSLPTEEVRKFTQFIENILTKTDYVPMSLNTSLGFAYTSTGKLDGFLNSYCHPWDICASSFLIQQAGGVITAKDGSEWTIETVGAIGALNPNVHKKLVELYNQK